MYNQNLQSSENFTANHSNDYESQRQNYQGPPVQIRESTFDRVRRIVERLVQDELISEEFGNRLIDEAAENPDFASTIKLLGKLNKFIKTI